MGCLFCNIVEKKIPAALVHEDEHTIAFRDINPVAPTHVLVIPKRHIASLADTTPGDEAILGKLLLAAKKVAAQEGVEASGFRTVFNTGANSGQAVFHIHMHVLGGRPMAWPPG